MGSRTNTTNWVVPDRTYDILLGISWHVKEPTTVEYVKGTVHVKGVRLPARLYEEMEPNRSSKESDEHKC